MRDEQPDEIQGQTKKEPWQSGIGNRFGLEKQRNPVVKIYQNMRLMCSFSFLHGVPSLEDSHKLETDKVGQG